MTTHRNSANDSIATVLIMKIALPIHGYYMYVIALDLEFFTCTDVIEPFLVVVILSCIVPISVARVG